MLGRSWLLIPLLLLPALGIILPKMLIPDQQEDWPPPTNEIARYARLDIKYNRGLMQKLLTVEISVIQVDTTPTDCMWTTPVSQTRGTGTFTVRAYTLFVIPFETWVVDCNSSSVTWSLWSYLPG